MPVVIKRANSITIIRTLWVRFRGCNAGSGADVGFGICLPGRRLTDPARCFYGAEMWALNHANINRVLEHQYPEVWDQIEALRSRGVRSSDPAMQKLFAAHRRLVRWYNPEHAGRLQTEPRSRHDDL